MLRVLTSFSLNGVSTRIQHVLSDEIFVFRWGVRREIWIRSEVILICGTETNLALIRILTIEKAKRILPGELLLSKDPEGPASTSEVRV
jgi:hypothetical protein